MVLKYILKQDQKIKKDGSPGENLKKIVQYYESLGSSQVMAKRDKYRKLYNLANGKITKEDYIREIENPELTFEDKGAKLDSVGLDFYPILPVIRNSILGSYNKKYIKYAPRVINREHTNSILESFNNDLRNSMVSSLQEVFLGENPNPTEEEFKLFQRSEKVQKAYKKEYRSEIEKWSHHIIKRDDLKHDIKKIERKLLDQIIVTEDPTVHLNYINGEYYPETLNENNTFHLKSTEADCYSESMMFGWFNYMDIGAILNKYADKLNATQVRCIEEWMGKFYSGFSMGEYYDHFTGNRSDDQTTIQNFSLFKEIENSDGSRYDEYNQDLFRETVMYFLLPRKIGFVTFRSPGEPPVKIVVDENFKETYKPIYEKGYPKTKDTLLEGEHVEWTYYNELYKAIKLDFSLLEGSNGVGATTSQGDQNSIWIECKKHDIQYSARNMKYGTSIPVYGGSVSNRYNESISLIGKGASWQIFYNWVINRSVQLVSTEIGKFWAFNQMAIPNESLEESWSKNGLMKWLMAGRDTSIAPLDLSVSNMGQSFLQGGIGQMVDLSRTTDILEKFQLAERIKIECYAAMGLNPEFIFGDFSPKQTATSVMQGLQRSSNQIEHIYQRLHDILRNLRLGMLETAQYIESNNPISEISYLTSDEGREIFKMPTKGLILHTFDIYIDSSLDDLETLERIKARARMDNTMGADAYEAGLIETADHSGVLLEKLKVLRDNRIQREQEAQQQQAQLQQQGMDMQMKQIEQKMAFDADQNEKDRQSREDIAHIKALGYGNSNSNEINKEIQEAIKLQSKLDNDKRDFAYKQSLRDLKKEQQDQTFSNNKRNTDLNERIKLKQLSQKDRELDIREKEARNTDERTNKL